MDSDNMIVKGLNGQIELSDDTVIIDRKGVWGRSEDFKEVFISQISAVEYKAAGTFTKGYISFTFNGDGGSLKGLTRYRNSIEFNKNQQPRFDELRERIVAIQASGKQRDTRPTTPPDDIGELERLALLVEREIITQEEFQAKKRQILGI